MSAGGAELFTLPRASVDYWAAETLQVAAGLAAVCDRLETATDDAELRHDVGKLRESAAALLLDFVAHGVVPVDHPANQGERLQLVPNVPAAVLGGLDKLDPLADGFRRVNSAHFAGTVSDDDGDEDSD